MAASSTALFHGIREAGVHDLAFLDELEASSFSDTRRSSRESLRRSIASSSQMVLVVEGNIARGVVRPCGAAVIFRYKRSLRIYSIAIVHKFRMLGLGDALMQHIMHFALKHGYERITLECDVSNARLVEWYRKFGFEPVRTVQDYYGHGEHALRMVLILAMSAGTMDRTIVVVDDLKLAKGLNKEIGVCLAQDYLSDTHYASSSRFQVLNLCSTHKTYSIGYYVSLLATARNHLVIPSVMAMKDATITMVAQSILDEIREFVQNALQDVQDQDFELTVILGKTESRQYDELARKLFALFSIPCFSISLHRADGWRLKRIRNLNPGKVLAEHSELFHKALDSYCLTKRRSRQRLRKYRYDLAILVNANEPTPPSCPVALERFRKAGEKVGFYVEFITREDKRRICEFDALFIRETTALDNHTYAMSRHAYTEGLVVIDDPWSIMLCSNKVFLKERFNYAGISQPRGWLLTSKTSNPDSLRKLPLPLVLKLPESSFSLGVYRANTLEELETRLQEMFRTTDLVIAQEFLSSEYDWRIGLLDNTPLFACKYYMASNHWQVCNWQTTNAEECYGTTDTIPLNQVPGHILKAAVNASMLIGNGLYGVDLKDINGRAYVIEVNDNPNIDAGSEDLLLGDELYERIMLSIMNRIEAERKQVRYLY